MNGTSIASSDGQRAAISDGQLTAARKADHVRINLEEDVHAKGVTTGFDRYRFVPLAIPDLNLVDVSTETSIFGRRLGAPVLISCMTGGTPEAKRINLCLAEVARSFNLPMGLGSGRVLLERPEVRPTFDVRRVAPDILLFCNLGAVQLNLGVGVEECRRLIELTGADALVLHLNSLQEALQPEGDTCFAGLTDKIAMLCAQLDVPVIAKEVGSGLAPDVVQSLFAAGVAAVDIAGAGGTSWSEVERYRMAEPWRAQVAGAFAGWGLPTAEAVTGARRAVPDGTIFASGGIRNGIDVAKAVALGADLVGIAGPFLRAAARGMDDAADLARATIETLRIAMFCTGAASIPHLRATRRLAHADGQPLSIAHMHALDGADGHA